MQHKKKQSPQNFKQATAAPKIIGTTSCSSHHHQQVAGSSAFEKFCQGAWWQWCRNPAARYGGIDPPAPDPPQWRLEAMDIFGHEQNGKNTLKIRAKTTSSLPFYQCQKDLNM